jgi:hypothetical protein
MNHFEGKSAADHIKEKKAEGHSGFTEAHGLEIPGHIHAAADALRETAVILGLVWILLFSLNISNSSILIPWMIFAVALIIWKTGRSAYLGWFRLERLHRVVEQEKYEIEHHRPQEREELEALYRLKGFEGKLLDEIVDVLMADQDRLLTVMLEEELGLKLAEYEHPLKQALGAFIGAFLSAVFLFGLSLLFPQYGVVVGSLILVASGAVFGAYFEKNRLLNAIVWNVGLAFLSLGALYFLIRI